MVGLYRSLGFETGELAVLAALTVGDKEELSDDIVETYSVSGASHVLALSGLHIGFISALLLFVLSPLWIRWRFFKAVFVSVCNPLVVGICFPYRVVFFRGTCGCHVLIWITFHADTCLPEAYFEYIGGYGFPDAAV